MAFLIKHKEYGYFAFFSLSEYHKDASESVIFSKDENANIRSIYAFKDRTVPNDVIKMVVNKFNDVNSAKIYKSEDFELEEFEYDLKDKNNDVYILHYTNMVKLGIINKFENFVKGVPTINDTIHWIFTSIKSQKNVANNIT